jgi:archaellum biogenesis ATPase FlaH
MFREALKLSFKNTIGRQYADELTVEDQYNYYHHKEHKYAMNGLSTFNEIMRGGCSKKKIHLILASTAVGKSLFLVNIATSLLKSGCNVLYITLEIEEREVIERIDGNMLDVTTESLPLIAKSVYVDKIKEIKYKSYGTLIVKEYPTASMTVNHVKSLLDELKIKRGFTPDFIMIDYLNIAASVRYKNIGDSYNYVKSIIEELRGLAMEKNVGIWTATQAIRSAAANSDINLTDVSESWAVAATADFLLGVTESDELKEQGRYFCKILKSRYAPIKPSTSKFLIGVNKEKQKLFDLEHPRKGLTPEEVTPEADKEGLQDRLSKRPIQSEWEY